MKIKIIGCGFAGLSSALLLSKLKNTSIEVYEKFEQIKPVGAGIVLQPSVLPVLQELNIVQEVNSFMEPINKVVGKNIKGKEIFLTQYKNEFGMGITRTSFFNTLYNKVKEQENIKVYLNYEVEQNQIENLSKQCDLLIICSGSRSVLNASFEKNVNKKYPFGCLWGMLPNAGDSLNILSQYVNGSKEMFGILPSGEMNNQRMLSVFWSVRLEASLNIQHEKNKIKSYKHFLSQQLYSDIMNMDFSIAEYRDIVMKKYHQGNILVIGDIAHAMSPQLGQGANMALLDSYLVYQLMKQRNNLSINNVLERYSTIRKEHIHFYSKASRFLTPLFQSNSNLNGIQRDLIFSTLGKTSFMQWMNTSILRGTRQSWVYDKRIHYQDY